MVHPDAGSAGTGWDTAVTDTGPEQMSSRAAVGWTVALAVLGGSTGLAWDGPFLAVACALSLGGGAALGTLLSRRRVIATLREGQGRAAALGYADGLADMMVLGISAYRASVFPLSGPDAVDPAERMARRRAAGPPTTSRPPKGFPTTFVRPRPPLSKRSTTGVTATPGPPSGT